MLLQNNRNVETCAITILQLLSVQIVSNVGKKVTGKRVTEKTVADFGRKHYENMSMQYTEIFKVVKNENFHWKIFAIFLIFAQNIDCGYTLEPNEYPQSMFWSKNKKNRYTLPYPSFAI